MYDDTMKRLLQIGLPNDTPSRADNPYRGFTLKKNIIMFPAFSEGLRRIAELHDHYRTGGRHGGLLITAMPGSGKTTLLEYYARAFPRYDDEVGTVIPVLYVGAPDQPTVGDLAGKVLLCLGDPMWDRGTAKAKKARAVELLKGCRVELILFDEFQHFYHGTRRSEGRKVPDWIKDIFNETKIPIVVAGLPISVLVIRDEENIQLRRRFSSPYHIAPFSIACSKSGQLRRLLQGIKEILPLPYSFIPQNDGFTKAVFYASNGSIDYIVKLFDRAVEIAGDERATSLEVRHFGQAFSDQIWKECPQFLNPFHPEAKMRPLTQMGEPFYGWTTPTDLLPKAHRGCKETEISK